MNRLLKIFAVFSWLAAGGVALATRSDEASPGAPAGERADSEQDGQSTKSRWKWRLLKLAGVLVVLGIGGFLVAASGIMPIKASSGHWAITAWFLNFSMGRSVSLHSQGIDPPPLDEPHLVLKGAGHYEFGCRPCHGSPELHHPRIAQAMTPHPPYLPPKIPEWQDEELFYIVKHGVKFTGMPAWPAQQREDEVWALVAFLRRFADMDATQYRQLVHGPAEAGGDVAPLEDLDGPESVPSAVRESCARCHGVDGRGRGTGAFPKLAGQQIEYLSASLVAYKSGERHSGIMEPLAAGLSDEDIHQLARYYGDLEGLDASPLSEEVASSVERGQAIAHRGIPKQRVPACVDCHGPGDVLRNPIYPDLAGQYADYVTLQLTLFKKNHRGGTAYAHIMRMVAEHLTEEQMRDVARYYESLASPPGPTAQ